MHTYARTIDGVRIGIRGKLLAKLSFTQAETLYARTVAMTIRRTLQIVMELHLKPEFIFE
jgi:hypothetical protein